jgi:hypothetical protein
VQECKRLSEANHPVACLMKGYMVSLSLLGERNSHLPPVILNHFMHIFNKINFYNNIELVDKRKMWEGLKEVNI